MTKVRIEKIDGNYRLEIDGDSHSHFSSTASDLITKPFTASGRCNGIFDTNTRFPEFANDSKVFTVDVGSPWSISDYANPVAEINRRVKLVRYTFARVDAEKEVWEGVIGGETIVPLRDNRKLEDYLSKYPNPPLVFRGEH
jgi:hypothetical protein